MSRKSVVLWVSRSALAVLVLTGCGSSGVASPITVRGVAIRVTSAVLSDSFGTGNDEVRPRATTDVILAVQATSTEGSSAQPSPAASAGGSGGAVGTWKVSVTDENEKTSGWSKAIAIGAGGPGQSQAITWLFVVSRTSRTFTLTFPDGQTMPLASVTTSAPPSTSP